MSKWKLKRLIFGNEEFTLSEGEEVTIGRGINNKIVLSSLLISRNHCVLSVKKDEVFITDLKSSNGIFIGAIKIPSNTPNKLKSSDVIGFGLTRDSAFPNVNDAEKYVFVLTKEENRPLVDRIIFQNEDALEEELLALQNSTINKSKTSSSPILDLKQNLKRKINQEKENVTNENKKDLPQTKTAYCYNEARVKNDPALTNTLKKVKLEVMNEELKGQNSEEANAKEEQDLELEAFNIKREYLGYDDDPILIDSESDSESEQWFLRLSQNSPGKPFIKSPHKSQKDTNKDHNKEDSSYSQMDDEENDIIQLPQEDNEDDEYMVDLISIPPQPPNYNIDNEKIHYQIPETDNRNLITSKAEQMQEPVLNQDTIDGMNETTGRRPGPDQIMEPRTIVNRVEESTNKTADKSFENRDIAKEIVSECHINTEANKIQLIAPPPLVQRRSKMVSPERKTKSSSKKDRKTSSSKRTITHSQKEERKRKLKEIAERTREQNEPTSVASTGTDDNKKAASSVNVKVTSTNRTMKMAESPPKAHKDKTKTETAIINRSVDKKSTKKETRNNKVTESGTSSEKQIEHVKALVPEKIPKKQTVNDPKPETSHKEKHNTHSKHQLNPELPKDKTVKLPVKSLKPLTDCEDSLSGKPLSKVEPLQQRKPKKSVKFAETAPEVREFEIEPGNRMKKTSLIKTTLVDVQRMPMFSLEKLTLMKVLRWNPKWLEEQVNNQEPPPILGHDSKPTALYHVFHNHNQYIQQVGDLLLMEIWESLSQAYGKVRNQNIILSMRIASVPPAPAPDRCFDIFSISVDISFLNTELKNLPKVGDILLVHFGPEKTARFFFVHNVKCLPSPPRNIHSYYNLSLHATFTQKMQQLKAGEEMTGLNLGHINKEMNLFEAMAYLECSPLSEAILRPEPRHFQSNEPKLRIKSPWTMTLNESQQRAVTSSVAAALGDKPCIQMIQGPPGTGKSSVICSIVMTYFYDEKGQRYQNRGKILICATSNAAVDGLVLKLLKIRQNLPKQQRFRMVRVGRLESMHERARDLSSQELAQRDAQRPPAPSTDACTDEEISLLNAKINKWKTAIRDAKDPVRVAYCEGKVKDLEKRKGMLLGGAAPPGEQLRPEQLALAERRIVEGADIIATTLASVHNHKMRGLKRRIALCIVDEAGQAIEPEALLPLTLDVTRLTLVGDPQQLPGYICSQRAKRLGLGDSLFSRLSSCAEAWDPADEQRAVQLLQLQYRMQPHIADYPNRAFYGARVRDQPPRRPDMPCTPYAVLGISSGDKGQAARGENEMEAWGVVRLAVALSAALRRAALPPAVTVITPYQAQRDAIKRKLRAVMDPAESEACSVEVNTVDSFQGQERDVVVVSLARSHGLGFVADAGRMNVLLTRARHALYVCLNPLAVQKNPQWRTLLEDAQRRNLYRLLPNQMCQRAGPVTDDDILSYISNQTNTHRSKR